MRSVPQACRAPLTHTARDYHVPATDAAPIHDEYDHVDDDALFGSWPPVADTIYQLSSGLGGGRAQPAVGVAVVRISGPLARPILMTLTRRRTMPQPRVATRASLYRPRMDVRDLERFERYAEEITTDADAAPAPEPEHLIDSGILVLSFPSPASFTGEDVVELHVHGTPLIVSNVFQSLEDINRRLVERIVAPPSNNDTSDPDTHKTHKSDVGAIDPASDDPAALSRLSAILACPPVIRLAQPGEFTRRAFMHGKLDLTQVEALGDLLLAETDRQKSQALVQMRGELGRFYAQWRLDLLNSLAYIEAVLDFSEDEQDVGESEIVANVLPKVRDIARSLEQHLSDHRRGELVRDGVGVVIVGSPNAGKSTLLNALAQRNVAIVSPVPGTTRDIVENRINIAGWACILADTAGLRRLRQRDAESAATTTGITTDTNSADALLTGHDLIEAEGMKRTHERTQDADIKLVLLDASQLLAPTGAPDVDAEVLDLIDHDSIVVWTKMDLVPTLPESGAADAAVAPASPSASTTGRAKLRTAQQFYAASRDAFTEREIDAFHRVASLSANYRRVSDRAAHTVFLACPAVADAAAGGNKGIQHLLTVLEKQIRRTVGLDANANDASASDDTAAATAASSSSSTSIPLITRHRHRVHVESCLSFLGLFEEYMSRGDLVLAAEQLRLATREIGKITGRVDVEELLDVIFEDFCIGK